MLSWFSRNLLQLCLNFVTWDPLGKIKVSLGKGGIDRRENWGVMAPAAPLFCSFKEIKILL